jgi:hypothetical protein
MRLAVGMLSVALGLASLSGGFAQTGNPGSGGSSTWSWLTNKAAPPSSPPPPQKPSSDPPVASGTAREQDLSPVHVLRKTTCSIPFTVDLSKHVPIELHLYVSQDRGSSWKFYAKAAPAEGRFLFRAAGDGEYWFALRSLEKNSPPFDINKISPGLKVIFDTREPEMRFDASLNDAGEVLAIWKVSDPTLVPESLKVEYQTESHAPWRIVSLPAGDQSPEGSLAGSHQFTPEGSGGTVVVRAEVSDRAGNKTVISRRLVARQLVTGKPGDDFRARTRQSGTYPVAQEGQSWPIDNKLPVPAPAANADSPVELPPPKPPTIVPGARQDLVPKKNPFLTAKQPASSEPPLRPPVEGSVRAPAVQYSRPEATFPAPAEEEVTAISEPAIPPPQSVPAEPAGPTSQAVSPDSLANGVPDPDHSTALPNGERPRMTKARQFSLDYEIDTTAPTNVIKVELWGTADGGRTWKPWQEDPDCHSPLDLMVDQDGIFGFRIVVTGANQLGGAPPQPGDPADLWVGVDTTCPTVRLTSALYGEGSHAGQLDIRWQAFDVWFPERPITLQFSEHARGPWSTIAAGLPNSGQYYWAADPRIPRRIYLRIEARDEAGNLAEHQISEPISTAGLVPQGRIRGIRTITPSPTDDRSAARK